MWRIYHAASANAFLQDIDFFRAENFPVSAKAEAAPSFARKRRS
jgi:hypothetical protein